MRILLITDEIWNDIVFGNNVLQNWFEGMPDVEIAQIGCLPIKPYNKVCTRYFQLTDSAMAKSIFGKRAGIAFETSVEEMSKSPQTKDYIASSPFYSFMKKISGPTVRLAREMVWSLGRYDKTALKNFVEDFKPDVVFCPRLLSWKLMRIENEVAKYTKAPFIAFTADDEASYRERNWSPVFWANRFFFHQAFKRHAKLYSHYLMFSKDQASEYASDYNLDTSELFKCGSFPETFTSKKVGTPIRMIYAGRLYCNRWKSLAEIGSALKEINKDGERMVLDIFTQDKLTEKQTKALSPENHIHVKGSVTPTQLKKEYLKADIALHVESLDIKNRLATRVSFSTKIIDLMASSCAIMAICWEEHTGYKYLKSEDAAICIPSYDKLLPELQHICDKPEIVTEYAHKAYDCGVRNHTKSKIQGQLFSEFQKAIDNNKRK